MLLKAALFFQLLHVVNQLHFKWDTGIPGVALTNLIFIVVVVLLQTEGETVTAKPILQKPILYFFGVITVAFLWGQIRAPGEFIEDLTYWKNALFFPLFYFLFFKCRQDVKTTRLLIIWVLVIAAVAGLEGLKEGISYGFGKYNAFHRASGPFGDDWHNANRAGVFYGMFMPMFVSLVLFLKGRKLWRLGAVLGCILLAGGAISTYSRQAYFLIILAMAVLLLRRSIIAAAAVAVILISAASFLPDSVTQRVEETHQANSTGEEEVDASTSSRWELWEGGLRMLAANPLGVGLNRWRAEIGAFCRYKKMDAHNFYMLTLGEMGPVGLGCLIYLFYSFFVLARFVRENRPPDDVELHALAVGFTMCTVNTCLGCIYGSPTFEGAVMAPYWALAGLLERYIHLKKAEMGTGTGSGDGITIEIVKDDSLAARFPLAGFITPGKRK